MSRRSRADQSKSNVKKHFLFWDRLVGSLWLHYCDVEDKMLNIIAHCKKVASSPLRAHLIDFIRVRPAVTARGYSRCSTRLLTANVASSQCCYDAQTTVTIRNYTNSSISNSSDIFQKESHVTDNDSSQSKYKQSLKFREFKNNHTIVDCTVLSVRRC